MPPPLTQRHLALSPSPPPSTQPQVSKASKAPKVTALRGKAPMKKTSVDLFNDNRRLETERLTSKRKMDHNERMASIHLKKRKYELRYGSTPNGTESPIPSMSTGSTLSAQDKEIEILRLKIRLVELTAVPSLLTAVPSLPHGGPFSTHRRTGKLGGGV